MVKVLDNPFNCIDVKTHDVKVSSAVFYSYCERLDEHTRTKTGARAITAIHCVFKQVFFAVNATFKPLLSCDHLINNSLPLPGKAARFFLYSVLLMCSHINNKTVFSIIQHSLCVMLRDKRN